MRHEFVVLVRAGVLLALAAIAGSCRCEKDSDPGAPSAVEGVKERSPAPSRFWKDTSLPRTKSEKGRPNIILILSDDAGYHEHGFHGNEDARTPHLDALAHAGVRFSQGYVSASVCAPSRAGLLTGRYQQRLGFENNDFVSRKKNSAGGLSSSEATLASRLRAAGYGTVAIGKWHLGEADDQSPRAHGFEHFFGLIGGSRPYFPMKSPKRRKRLLSDHGPFDEEFEYLTDLFADAASDYINRAGDTPFFMYLAPTAPHGPLEAKESKLALFPRLSGEARIRAAMMASLDDLVGGVVASLKSRGVLNDTFIFYCSDNGGPLDLGADNTPLAQGKGTLYEGGVRVPMFVHYPAFGAPRVFEDPVSTLDLTPTLMALAGVKIADAALDGQNLLPALKEPSSRLPERDFWFRNTSEEDDPEQSAVRRGAWKLLRTAPDAEAPGTEQYVLADLTADPGEKKNLIKEHPEIASQLIQVLKDQDRTIPSQAP